MITQTLVIEYTPLIGSFIWLAIMTLAIRYMKGEHDVNFEADLICFLSLFFGVIWIVVSVILYFGLWFSSLPSGAR